MQSGNPYKQVTEQLQGARDTMGQARTGMQGYMNAGPNRFQSQVIDNTIDDMGRANSMALNDVSAQATGVGAFGGSRHGIAEAETNRAFADRAGNMSANMRMQDYNNTLQRQFQGAQGLARMGTQQSNLANLGFGMLNTVSDRQARDGAIRRGLNQSVIDAAKGQYGGFIGAPYQGLGAQLNALQAAQFGQTTTQTSTPGLFDFLTLGATLGA